MELRHLRYFVAVAEDENVSRAAARLHISQPAVSAQIRDLEDEIGFLLLERTAKSVSLTEAGRIFLQDARELLRSVDGAVNKARAIAAGGAQELHVGYSPTPTTRLLPPILRAFQKAMPNVQVKLHDWSNEQNLAGLTEGKLHLAFTVHPPNAPVPRKLRFEPLAREACRLAVAPRHPLARRRTVPLADAALEPILSYSREEYPDYYKYLTETFSRIKAKPRVVEEHDGFSGLIAAIEAGTGVALVGESFGLTAGSRVKILRLTPEPEPAIIGIAAPKGQLAPAAEEFWQCAVRTVPQH